MSDTKICHGDCGLAAFGYLLDHEADKDADKESVTVSFGCEEARPAGGLCGLTFQFDGLADLLELVLDKLVVPVTVCVVLSQDFKSLLIATFGDQPSR
jgi:hypothetical protein